MLDFGRLNLFIILILQKERVCDSCYNLGHSRIEHYQLQKQAQQTSLSASTSSAPITPFQLSAVDSGRNSPIIPATSTQTKVYNSTSPNSGNSGHSNNTSSINNNLNKHTSASYFETSPTHDEKILSPHTKDNNNSNNNHHNDNNNEDDFSSNDAPGETSSDEGSTHAQDINHDDSNHNQGNVAQDSQQSIQLHELHMESSRMPNSPEKAHRLSDKIMSALTTSKGKTSKKPVPTKVDTTQITTDSARSTTSLSTTKFVPTKLHHNSEQQSKSLLFGSSTQNKDKETNEAEKRTNQSINTINEVKERLAQRGEKLKKNLESAERLNDASSEFAKMAKELKRQQQNRWF